MGKMRLSQARSEIAQIAVGYVGNPIDEFWAVLAPTARVGLAQC
jgi:hypothetical protein